MAINFYHALPGDNFHSFRLVGSKVIGPLIYEAERLFAAILEANRVADDLAIKIDIRFGDGGYVGKLSWQVAHGNKCFCVPAWSNRFKLGNATEEVVTGFNLSGIHRFDPFQAEGLDIVTCEDAAMNDRFF